MRPIVPAMFIIAAAFSSNLSAGTFRPPDFPENEVRYYKSYYARAEDKPDLQIVGSKLMHSESSKAFREWVEWQGEGAARRLIIVRDAVSYNDTRSINRFTMKVGNGFKLLRFDRKWTALDGSVLREWEFDFTDPSLGYPGDTFHHMILSWLASSLDYSDPTPVEFHVWLDTTMVYPMLMAVDGEEKIKTAAGEFDCYRVVAKLDKTKLDDIIAKILGRAMPQYTYLVEKGGHHGLVRLQWPIFTGAYGDSTRFQTQELVKIETRIN